MRLNQIIRNGLLSIFMFIVFMLVLSNATESVSNQTVFFICIVIDLSYLVFLVLFFGPKMLKQLNERQQTLNLIKKFLGPTYLTISANVKRSSNGKRQFRVGGLQNKTFWHFEQLDSDGVTIIEETTMLASYKYFEDEKVKERPAYFYFVALVKNASQKRAVLHYWGIPPDLTNRVDERQRLGWPNFLFIREEAGGYSLYHLAQNGSYLGSTWHPTLQEAREQAAYEYGDLLSQWELLPSKVKEVKDVVQWVDESTVSI